MEASLSKITPDMKLLDIVATWEKTQQVFKHYDSVAGECICCNALFDTLGDTAARYSLDLENLSRELEAAADRS